MKMLVSTANLVELDVIDPQWRDFPWGLRDNLEVGYLICFTFNIYLNARALNVMIAN